MKHAWIPAALCGLGLTLGAAERLLIEDFSDVGTWRSNPVRNTTPGKWFGADVYLGATPDASRDDGYAGKLLFHFADASKARRNSQYCRNCLYRHLHAHFLRITKMSPRFGLIFRYLYYERLDHQFCPGRPLPPPELDDVICVAPESVPPIVTA